MITIPELVKEKIEESPYLEELLAKGIINYSALARTIKLELEEKLLKSIKEGSIIMALRRMVKKYEKNLNLKNIFSKSPDMIIRSNLVEFTFTNSDLMLNKYRNLLKNIEVDRQYFFAITQGVFETGIIISQELEEKIREIFEGEKIIHHLTNLSAITIKLPKENVTTSGVYYFILKALALNNINIIELVSTYQEITLILETKEIDKAFSILKKTLST
ncbi:MAG: hypothetical protein AAB859_02370 [Patescibacteria group bacterium]